MRPTLRDILIAVAAVLAAPSAFAQNLLSNGSFENGLNAWTLVGTPTTTSTTTFPPVTINYNSATAYPTGAFGESAPTPTDLSSSPDAVGTHGAYFVDDNAVNQGLAQSVFLSAGHYLIGYDVYAPGNGFVNPNDARFSATIAGVSLNNFMVSAEPEQTWIAESALIDILVDGIYDTSFIFNTPGTGAAKDVVIDRAFIVATDATGGTPISPIPEPGVLALTAIATLGGVTAARRRKPRD
jgi:hypothetical protein